MNTRANRAVSIRTGAFMLVEVVVGMGILAIVFVSLYAAFSFGFGVIRLLRENVRATQILQEKMEIVRLYNWEQIASTNYVPRTFSDGFDPTNKVGSMIYSGTISISNAPIAEAYRSNLLQVTAHIIWTSGNVQRQREMRTFVSRYGMQNYFF